MLLLQGLGPLSARDFKPCASQERLRTSWPCVRAEEQPTACIAQGMAAPGAAMKAETSQFRAAVLKKRKRDEKGSGSGEDDEGGSEMIVHVPKAVEKRIKACVLMDPELGNMSVTKALAVEGLKMSRPTWSASDWYERYEEEGIDGLFKDKRHKVPKQMTPGTKGFVVDKADKGMNAPEIQKEVEKKRKDENDDRSAPSIEHTRRTLNKEGGKYTRRRSGPGSSSTGRGTGAASTTWCCAWRTSSRRSSRKMGTEPSKTLPLSLILSKPAIVASRTVLISPYCSFLAGLYPHAPEFSPKAPTLV